MSLAVTIGTLGLVLAGTHPPPLPAPHQIEGVERTLVPPERGAELAPPIVLVDLGPGEGPPPDREAIADWRLLGTRGSCAGSLLEPATICEYLCGDKARECHHVARVVPACDADALGVPLAAIPGRHAVLGYRPHDDAALGAPRPFVVAGDETTPFVRTAWPPEPETASTYRLAPSPEPDRELRIEIRWPGGTAGQTIDDTGCTAREVDGLTEVTCSMTALLLDADGRPLLVSLADYGPAAAAIVASFEHGGRRYRVAQLGLKAQVLYGLLVEDDDGGWRLLAAPRRHALLC